MTHHDQAQGSGDDEYDDWLQPIDPPCHRCGSNRAHMGYGLGCGPMGTYTVCECGCVLAHSPDMEGLTDEECATVREASEALLAHHKLNGRQRWLLALRQRRRSGHKRRALRKCIDRMMAKHGKKPLEKMGRARVHLLTGTELL